MALIDYKKAYRMVPHSRIKDCLKMHRITDGVIKFMEETLKNWRVELTTGGKSLAEMKIPRGIFQGDALSLLLLLGKYTGSYKLTKLQEKTNNLMYMEDIKLFAKKEKELETLIQLVGEVENDK